MSAYERIHHKIISVFHGTLYSLFKDPYKILKAAGLSRGQSVLEVGAGSGFFTLPAAEIVGSSGSVCALDINRIAVESLRQRVEKKGIENIDVRLADATDTKQPDDSIDLAFLFGVIHAFDDVRVVIQEMHRVLKPNGILSVQKGRWSERRIVKAVTQQGLFKHDGRTKNIIRFLQMQER